ncbi:hypothetical protein GGI11_009076, partial [Coemansia sp. RSA 2049]
CVDPTPGGSVLLWNIQRVQCGQYASSAHSATAGEAQAPDCCEPCLREQTAC